MKKSAAVLSLLAVLAGPAVEARQVELGISVSDGNLKSFYLAVGGHYRVPPRQVADLGSRYRLPDEELPVLFFLAARAQVGPRAVIDLRLARLSWLEIALRLRLSPEIFFVPVTLDKIGPPYGNAYGYYRKYGRSGDWRKVVLSDREVVDLVNLRFMSEYHGMKPDVIIGMRAKERSFVRIHDEIGKGKAGAAQGKGPKGQPESKRKKK